MKVLITGGAGFIGGHTADLLVAQGHAVRILDCLDPQIHGENADFPTYLPVMVERLRGDVRDVDAVTRALDGMDAVIHLAALTGVGQSMYELRRYTEVNLTGTATLLEGLIRRQQPIQRLVLASSRAVYGEGSARCVEHGLIHPEPRRREDLEQGRFAAFCPMCGQTLEDVPTPEERPLKPLSVYAWTKEQQEQLCRYAARTFGLPVTLLRYFNVYGPRQSLNNPYTGIVAIFYSRIRAGQPIFIYERNQPLRDMVSVSDVARANVQALTADIEPGASLNIGAGNRYTIAEVATALMRAVGRDVELIETTQFRMGDILQCHADLDRSRRLLGYAPQVDLDTGMADFVAWAAAQHTVDLYQQTVDELKSFNLFGQAGS